MIKQAIILKIGGKPVMCSSLVTFKSPEEFKEKEKECQENFLNLVKKYDDRLAETSEKISLLEKRLFLNELETLLLRGKITKEEYELKRKEVE